MADEHVTTAPIREQLHALARSRSSLAELKDDLAKRRLDFDAVNAGLSQHITEESRFVAQQEAAIAAMALALFEAEPENKRPAAGVSIKMMTALHYPTHEALAWAKITGLALVPESLDAKTFEKIVKAMPPASRPKFVKIEEIPQAQIASDLEKALSWDGETPAAQPLNAPTFPRDG